MCFYFSQCVTNNKIKPLIDIIRKLEIIFIKFSVAIFMCREGVVR